MQRKFKYYTTFAAIIRCPINEERDEYLATASLADLKPFLPANVDLATNWDLLPFSTNVYVANLGNENSDMIDTAGALSSTPNFVYKPIDLEHLMHQRVGVITTAGFSKFTSNYAVGASSDVITSAQAGALKEPFNITIGGFIWKVANDDLVSRLEESNDPEHSNYLKISASFEMGFDTFYMCVGKSRNIQECQIIKDDKEIERLIPYLKTSGGKGKLDGNYVFRYIIGDITPIGAAFTLSPAAAVKGVLINTNNSSVVSDIKNDAESSQLLKTSVKGNEMKSVKTVEEIRNLKQEDLAGIAVASLSETFQAAINEYNADWSKKQEEAKNALALANDNKTKAEAKVKEIDAELQKLNVEIADIKNKAEAASLEKKFQDRMSTLDTEYDLSADDRKVIAKNIQSANDEAFKAWLGDFEVICAAKKKKKVDPDAKKEDSKFPFGDKEKEEEADAKKTAKASSDEKKTAEEILAQAKEKKDTVASATVTEGSLMDRYKLAFSKENVTISK